MRRNPWKQKYWTFLSLARSKEAVWTPKQVFEILKILWEAPQLQNKRARGHISGFWSTPWSATENDFLKPFASGGIGEAKDVQYCMAKPCLVGPMVQSHWEPYGEPQQPASGSREDAGCLHGPQRLLLHHCSVAHLAPPLLLALTCWLWHFACQFERKGSPTSWLPQNTFAWHVPHHLLSCGFDPASQARLWQGCDCRGGLSVYLWLRGWEAWHADGPIFVWTGCSSLCHWARLLSAGNSTELCWVGCSPTKGGAGAAGNDFCSGTEENTVGGGGGGGGGEPSGLSRKFRALEASKKKNRFSKPFPLQMCCYCWQNTWVATFWLLLLRHELCEPFWEHLKIKGWLWQ